MDKELKEIFNLGIKKRNHEIDLSWQELSDKYPNLFDNSGENVRQFIKRELRKQGKLPNKSDCVDRNIQNKLNEIDLKMIKLRKEQKKIQSIKVEYNKILRENSRAFLYIEQLKDSIQNLNPLDIPIHKINSELGDKILLVNISDPHVGKFGIIKGLNGEQLNKYNFDIFQRRMWSIFDEVLSIIRRENINSIYLLCEGDCVDGILRQSQLQSIEMGVTDSIIKYSEFMSNYINELSKHVYVNYYSAYGNHDSLRLLSSKSQYDFPHENVGRLIDYFLKIRLDANKNVEINDNHLPYSFFSVFVYNILIHNVEYKNLVSTVKDYMSMYNKHIDLMICGHMHSGYEQDISLDTKVIRIPSICGIDDFSVRIHKFARPATKLLLLNKINKNILTYDINLN
jgi:hypothetical protein